MFGFLTRVRRASRTVPIHRSRLTLEPLEGRVVPALTISSMTGHVIGSHVVITGQVEEDSPGSTTVAIAGTVNGSVHTNDSGAFEFIANANGAVVVSAVATDALGHFSGAFGL